MSQQQHFTTPESEQSSVQNLKHLVEDVLWREEKTGYLDPEAQQKGHRI